MITGTVLSIERCSLHDGPGLRTTVFLKGCPLSCLWCHNPESRSSQPELYFFDEKCTRCAICEALCVRHTVTTATHTIDREACTACGRCVAACPSSALEIKGMDMSAADVMAVVMKDRRFYQQSGGGLTLSGGEPMAQYTFTRALLCMARESGLHTCLETSGFTAAERLLGIIPYVDLFLYDYKESDEALHQTYIGVSRDVLMENLFAIDQAGAAILLRCPIIPGYNDRAEHFAAIAATANRLRHIQAVHIMPYHPMGASKAKRVGRAYPLPEIGFPTETQIEEWRRAIQQGTDVPVTKG